MSPTAAPMYLSTPGNWVALDLDLLGDEDRLRDLVEDRLAELPGLDRHREELVEVLARSSAAARDVGVAFAAVMIDAAADDSPLLASLTVAVVEWPGDPPTTDAGQQSVLLPAGEAAWTEAVRSTTIAGGAELLVLTTQYVLAIPGAGALAVLTFTSPNVLQRERFAALFLLIAEALELPTGD